MLFTFFYFLHSSLKSLEIPLSSSKDHTSSSFSIPQIHPRFSHSLFLFLCNISRFSLYRITYIFSPSLLFFQSGHGPSQWWMEDKMGLWFFFFDWSFINVLFFEILCSGLCMPFYLFLLVVSPLGANLGAQGKKCMVHNAFFIIRFLD